MTIEMNWIPVTKRLPEFEEEVLVTRRFLGTKDIAPSVYVEVAKLIYADDDGYQEWVSNSDDKILDCKHEYPIAWMSLPLPWKGE